jgi:hypothetical protein
MYEKFAPELFNDLKQTSNDWLRSTRDRFIFETFIMQAGKTEISRIFLYRSFQDHQIDYFSKKLSISYVLLCIRIVIPNCEINVY